MTSGGGTNVQHSGNEHISTTRTGERGREGTSGGVNQLSRLPGAL